MAQLLEFGTGLGRGVFGSVLLVCFMSTAPVCPSASSSPRLVCFVALLPDGLKINQCVK